MNGITIGCYPKLSILIATYNRSEILSQTLTNFTELNCEGLVIEIVVVDNNSSDGTRDVIESFQGRLPLRYLFEQRPGKNCALNKALDEIELADIVVFTDDDVKPEPDWLQKIIGTAERWPEINVFGGKIFPIWPYDPPKWLMEQPKELLMMAYAVHDFGDNEDFYDKFEIKSQPFGANMWVRRVVFDSAIRFNEDLGPRPKNRIMGSESSFLLTLKNNGEKIIYSPSTKIGHYISRSQMSISSLRRRAFRCGRQGPIISGLCRQRLFNNNLFLWRLIRIMALVKYSFIFLLTYLHISSENKYAKSISAAISVGYNWESLVQSKVL